MTESTLVLDEPPTALPPPAVIRVLTINVQGGLTPNLSQANCTKDKLARAVDFLDAGYVCVCAQECGFPSDSPPPPLSRRTSSARSVHPVRWSSPGRGSFGCHPPCSWMALC